MNLEKYNRIRIIYDSIMNKGDKPTIEKIVTESLFHSGGTIDHEEAKYFLNLITNFQIDLNNHNDKLIKLNDNNVFCLKSNTGKWYLTNYQEYNEEKIVLLQAFQDFCKKDKEYVKMVVDHLKNDIDYN